MSVKGDLVFGDCCTALHINVTSANPKQKVFLPRALSEIHSVFHCTVHPSGYVKLFGGYNKTATRTRLMITVCLFTASHTNA